MGILARLGKALGFSRFNYGPNASTTEDYIDSTVTIGERAAYPWAGRQDQRQLTEQAAGYVLICAMLNARYCAQVPVRLYRRSSKAGGAKGRRAKAWMLTGRAGAKAAQAADRSDGVEEVAEHPVLEVLRRPNVDETGTDYSRFLYLCRWLNGNGYEYVIDPLGADRGMRCLFPGYVSVIAGDDRLVGGYRYGRDQSAVRFFEASEVVHHRHMPSVLDPFYGMSPLNAVMTENQTMAAAVYRELMSILNDRRPDFAVVFQPGTQQAQIDRAREFFRREHKGPSKVKLPLMAEGVDIKTFGWSNRDMEAPELMAQFEKAIKDAYGVGDMLDSKSAGQISIGSGGVGDAEKRYLRQTILPEVVAVCELRTDFLLPMFGLDPANYWFAPDNPVVDDKVSERQSAVLLVQNGALTINELRAEEGLDPIEGGDVPRVNGTPLDRVGMVTLDPFGGGGGALEDEEDDDEGDEPPEPDGKRARPASRKDRPNPRGAGPAYSIDDRPVTLAREKLAEALRRWFRSDLAPAMTGAVQPDGTVRLDMDRSPALVESFNIATLPSLEDLFRVGYNRGVAEVNANGASMAPQAAALDTDAAKYLRDYQGRLIRSVSDTTSRDIQRTLAEGLAANETQAELADRVQAALGPAAARYRANLIADTESSRAYEAARAESWKRSGIVTGKQWLLSGDPCEVCLAIAAQYGTTGNGEPFAPMGTAIGLPSGRTFVADYGPLEPPAHPACRCSARPIYRSNP